MLQEELRTLRSMSMRDFVNQLSVLALIVGTALTCWKCFMLFSNSESPVVVVLSESMAPGYNRGDLLLLNMWSEPIQPGDICVFKLDGRDVPIVHRVHRVHEHVDGETYILTKGDNNPSDDRSLYNPGQDWIHVRHLMGRSKAYLPYVGMLTIVMAENPILKVLLLAALAFFVIASKEES